LSIIEQETVILYSKKEQMVIRINEINPFRTSVAEPFRAGKSALNYFLDRPQCLDSGAILLCLSGEAELTVNMHHCLVGERTEVLIIPQEICMVTRKTDDFRVIYFAFSHEMFYESSFRLSPDYFGFIKENSHISLPENDFQSNVAYLKMMEELYHDRNNRFRDKMATNYLQNYLLNSYDKICRYNSQIDIREADRQNKLFKRFVHLLHIHCTTVREVSFYANNLSISTRYLSAVTQRSSKMSAKRFIDDCVTQEIKLRLHSTELSIQEIADRLNFPDQSYLGRFFKKQTGISPSEYRKNC
jgi:AraC-like DNA-binding protein